MAENTRQILALILLMVFPLIGTTIAELNEPTVIQASEIISKVINGEAVDYNDVLIKGNLDLSNIDLLKGNYVSAPIRITDSVIYGGLNFNNTVIKESIDFHGTKILGPAGFIGTRFGKDANFEGALFNEFAFFRNAQFDSSPNFERTRFNGPANFLKVHFYGGPVNFHYSEFKGPAIFWSSEFRANPDDIEGDIANFEESKFIGLADFRNITFSKSANFRDCQFNNYTDFRSTNFKISADFIGARFNRDLCFIDVKFTLLNANWASLEDKLICNGPTYLALIANFKTLGQIEDADNCYYQYRDWNRKDRPFGWLKILDYLSWLSCGYGVRWHYTILSGIMVIVLFGLYYESCNLKDIIPKFFYKENPENTHKSELKQSLKRAVSVSAITLLSLPSDWYPYGRDEYTAFVKRHLCLAIFERIIGWGLMLLLIGTLSRLMVRY